MPCHTIPPVFDSSSKILILGSFPSVKSRETAFFYGHPQNRFWKVVSSVIGCDIPSTIEEKKNMLIKNHIAVWDVIASCEINGSSDSSITSVVPNDLAEILNNSEVNRIFTNGNKASQLYKKFILPKTGIEAVTLPSTSPANAGYSLERLIYAWKTIINA